LSETGRRQRLFFATRGLAQAECEKLKARRDNFGTSLSNLTAAQIAQAAEAFDLLSGQAAVSLAEIVREHLRRIDHRAASVTFSKLFEAYLASKEHRTPKYQRALRNTHDRFTKLHAKLVCDVTPRELEVRLLRMPGGSRNEVMRHLRAVFGYGVKRKYLSENPINQLDYADRPRKEVEILSVDQIQAMLNHALEHDPGLLPFLVLGFYTGIRPDGELIKLQWSDVDLVDRVVVIRPEVSKTRRRRFVDLSDNAKAWLNAYADRGGTFTGPVVRYTAQQLRSARRANKRAAGITHWPQSAMRHSFCSYWLAQFKDVNRLTLLSGHDNVDTMWRHYHRGTPEAEAKRYWALVPPVSGEKKILAFRARAAS
jgi:integrase